MVRTVAEVRPNGCVDIGWPEYHIEQLGVLAA
jgi:hypothetical protein